MCLGLIPPQPSRNRGTSQYRLTKCDAAQGCRVETAEWMKRIALHRRAFHGLVDEAEVEVRVVSHQHRTTAAVLPDCASDLPKGAL